MTQWIITSSLLILAVLIIRALGRDRLSGGLRYALWGLVLLRLLMPFSLGESVLSLQNYLPQETRQTQISETYVPSDTTQTTQTGGTIQMPQTPQMSVTEGEKTHYVNYPMLIWTVGAVIVGGVFLVSNLRFYLRLRRSRKIIKERFVPIYECAAVETPCLFGFPRPAIYVTPEVMADELALRHVLAHELTHRRHGDHIWSLLRCICVTLHWYNPLVWVAAYLSQQDAELACDEGTLRQLGDDERTAYAKTLLDLTCVGMRGMLTAATSMTGSDSDLKTRVLRIVKNPKMPLAVGAAVLIVAAIAAVSVFTGAMSPKIEGVWRLEMSYLGGDTEGPASAYMEYEFYDTRGIRTDHVGGELRSAEWFSYTIDDESIELLFDSGAPAQTYTYQIENDTLTLTQKNREMTLTRVEYAPLPFLDEGVIDVTDVHEYVNARFLDLTDVESAQLVHLLRSGDITVIRDYAKNGIQFGDYNYSIITGQGSFTIGDGVITPERNDSEDGYVLSNMDEILAWLEALEWNRMGAAHIGGMPYYGEPVEGQVSIGWGLLNNRQYTTPANQEEWEVVLDALRQKTTSERTFTDDDEEIEFHIVYNGERWYFQTNGAAYIAGAELYLEPDGAMELLQLLQPYVDLIDPAVGKTLPYAGTTHYISRVYATGYDTTFTTEGEMRELAALLHRGMGEPRTEEGGYTCDEYRFILLSSTLGIAGNEIVLTDQGELIVDYKTRYTLSNADEVLRCANGIMNGTANLTPDEQLEKKLAEELHFSEEYPITVELLAKTEVNGRSFALAGVQNDVYGDYLVEYTETLDHYSVQAWDAAIGTPPEVAGYWPNYAVMGGTYLCWSVIPTERMATTPDGKAVDMNAEGFAVNDYTAIRFRMKNGSTIDAPIANGGGTRLMLQMFDGQWPVSSVPMVGKTEVTVCEMTFEYATTGYPDGSLGAVIDGESLEQATRLAVADYEAWRDEEWCLSMEVLDAAVNEAESERLREMYEGFEEGWSREYLAENFVVVRVTYKCELDHTKIFYPDGTIEKDTLLVRDNPAADWEIWDYSAEISIDPPDGRGQSEVE